MQIYDWSINHSGREIHSCSDREKGNPIGRSGRWAIIFGHANFVDLLIAHGNWKLWNYDFLPASSTPRQHMPIAADWYVMSIVILFAGTLTFHRRDAMCCDAMRCHAMWSVQEVHLQLDRPPPTWDSTSSSTAHTSCMFIYKFDAPDYKIEWMLHGWLSFFFLVLCTFCLAPCDFYDYDPNVQNL